MADLIRERVREVVQETLMHGLKYQNDVNGSCYIDEWRRSWLVRIKEPRDLFSSLRSDNTSNPRIYGLPKKYQNKAHRFIQVENTVQPK